MFPASDPRKWCPDCRAVRDRHQSGAKYKAARSKFKGSEKGQAAITKWNHSDKQKEIKAKYYASDKGREAIRKRGRMPMHLVSASLYKMARGIHDNPITIPALGTFSDNEDVRQHLESTFDLKWMNWDNHGKYSKGAAYQTTWSIGHTIPKSIYDASNIEDLKRCWHRQNLFAQDARTNHENNDRNVLTDQELIAMKPFWPVAAEDDISKLKALF